MTTERIHLYSTREERLNTLTHFIAAILSIIGLILMIFKIQEKEHIIIFAMLTYIIATLLVYTSSSIYHHARNIEKKIFWQKIDHSMVSMIILGTAAPSLLIIASGEIANIMLIIVTVVTFTNITLNLISVSKYKRYSQILYLAGAIAMTIGIVVDIQEVNDNFMRLFLAGVIVIVLGSIFYMKKSKEYTHFIWHLADIICSILHFLAFYLFIL